MTKRDQIFLTIIGILVIIYAGREILVYYNDYLNSQNPKPVPIEENICEPPEYSNQEEIISEEPKILSQYQNLYNQNPDMIGYLNIPDAKINYPIMDNCNDFYLHHDFHQNDSAHGVPYIGYNTDITDHAILIYGHNMKDKTMFGNLTKFLDKDFFDKCEDIICDTLYESRKFEVIGVFKSWVHTIDEDGYRFYNFYGNPTENEFEEFKDYLKETCIYSKDLDSLNSEDHIIQLVTCAYHRENGRLVVVLKERS